MSTPASNRTNPLAPWHGRLVVLAGIAVVALNARLMVAVVSPIITIITRDLPLTNVHEEIIGAASPACFALFGLISPWLGRKFGLEPMIIVALAVSSVGVLGRTTVHTPAGFIVWSVLSLAGAGIGNVITPPLIKKYFPDRVAAVTGTYTFFAALSTALPPLFIYNIAQATGWRFSIGVWAAVGVAGLVPWIIVALSPSRAPRHAPGAEHHHSPKPVWKFKVAWGITVVFIGNSMIVYTMFTWLPHMLRDSGISDHAAALYLGVFTVTSLPGSLLTPILAARLKRTWILPVVFFSGYVVSFTALAINPGHLTLLWILISRFGDCFFPYAITMINLRTRTTRGSIAMSGFVQTVGYTFAIIGPWGFGFLHSLTGNWHIPMIAVIAYLPVMLVGGLIAANSEPADI